MPAVMSTDFETSGKMPDQISHSDEELNSPFRVGQYAQAKIEAVEAEGVIVSMKCGNLCFHGILMEQET